MDNTAQLSEVSELIKDLWWSSETDESWQIEVWDNLEQIEKVDTQTVDLDNFFAKAVQTQSWYGETENQEVEQYQKLVSWFKANLSNLQVYRIGSIEIDIYVVGLLNNQWIVLKTKAVET